MREEARKLAEGVRRQIAPLDQRILQHPYLIGLEGGQIPRESLAIFAGQQWHIIGSDLRSVALAVSRASYPSARDFFAGVLQGERMAFDHLLGFGRALGLAEEGLAEAEPLAGAFAYTAFVAWLALYGSEAEFAGAFLINLPAWGANCGRMSRALKARYGLPPEGVAFFDLFATPPPGFEDNALAVVADGLARGAQGERIARAARLLQGYELLFWDTIHQASTR